MTDTTALRALREKVRVRVNKSEKDAQIIPVDEWSKMKRHVADQLLLRDYEIYTILDALIQEAEA